MTKQVTRSIIVKADVSHVYRGLGEFQKFS
jgi:hypothetical protein